MTFQITFLGHNAWWIEIDGHKLILDPFLKGSPVAVTGPNEVDPDFILLSHGHGDHLGDTVDIAKRTGAPVITNADIEGWLRAKGVANVHSQNLGGGYQHPFGHLKFTIAHHSSMMPDGAYGGNPAGFILTSAGGRRVYFACDTALFMDMQLYAGADVAVLPIGDNYTMGPEDALKAVDYLRPKVAIPCHFNTFPVIAQDGDAWAEAVSDKTSTDGLHLKPGESYVVEE
jgi:L-ascorbate metabolism protein UlaG (beta-lactamase superfamily)